MISDHDKERLTALLKKLGIAANEIRVFGAAQLNVHVICKGRTTADKWALALSTIEPGRKITCTPQRIERRQFKADARNQTHVRGWLVAL